MTLRQESIKDLIDNKLKNTSKADIQNAAQQSDVETKDEALKWAKHKTQNEYVTSENKRRQDALDVRLRWANRLSWMGTVLMLVTIGGVVYAIITGDPNRFPIPNIFAPSGALLSIGSILLASANHASKSQSLVQPFIEK